MHTLTCSSLCFRRACKPLSDVYEITKCQADEEDAAVNEVTLGDKKASGAQYVQEAFNELQKGPSPARMMFFGVTEDVEKGFELANIHGLDRHGSVHVTRPRTEGDLVGMKTRLFTLDIVSSKADVAARLKAAKRKAEGQSKEVRFGARNEAKEVSLLSLTVARRRSWDRSSSRVVGGPPASTASQPSRPASFRSSSAALACRASFRVGKLGRTRGVASPTTATSGVRRKYRASRASSGCSSFRPTSRPGRL